MFESDLLGAALEYAEAEIPVPCERDEEGPATPPSFNGGGIAVHQTKTSPHSGQAKGRNKRGNRFGGLSPSEGATLPPLSYWDEAKTLPRSDMGGCVGFLVGHFGSHKTGTAIMMALDAIKREGARVLFIAA